MLKGCWKIWPSFVWAWNRCWLKSRLKPHRTVSPKRPYGSPAPRPKPRATQCRWRRLWVLRSHRWRLWWALRPAAGARKAMGAEKNMTKTMNKHHQTTTNNNKQQQTTSSNNKHKNCKEHVEVCNLVWFDFYESCPKSLRWAVGWKNDKRKNDNSPQWKWFYDLFSLLISLCASFQARRWILKPWHILKTFTARVYPLNSSFSTL